MITLHVFKFAMNKSSLCVLLQLYVNNQPLTIPVREFQSPYSFMLSGQEPNTTYNLSVSAVTDFIKEGPKSDTISVTTLAQSLFYEPRVLQTL